MEAGPHPYQGPRISDTPAPCCRPLPSPTGTPGPVGFRSLLGEGEGRLGDPGCGKVPARVGVPGAAPGTKEPQVPRKLMALLTRALLQSHTLRKSHPTQILCAADLVSCKQVGILWGHPANLDFWWGAVLLQKTQNGGCWGTGSECLTITLMH